jgi:hypothetical protein
MDCEAFESLIGSLAGENADALPPHARECPACAERLRRARLLVTAIQDLPREEAPPVPAAAILARHRAGRRALGRRVLRAAAALLLLAGIGAAVGSVLRAGPGYRPLDLVFVQVSANGDSDEEIALEEVYGPDMSIPPAGGGAGGDASNR